jgi:hypothetical protein
MPPKAPTVMASSPSEPTGPAELTEPQRRHLRVFLHQIEAAIAEVEWLTEQVPQSRILRTDVADLPPDFGARIRSEVARVRHGIQTLAVRFGLGSTPWSRFRRAQAILVTAGVEIEDTTARSLRAYGPVHPALERELDPVLEDISHALRIMASVLVTSGAPADQPPRPHSS